MTQRLNALDRTATLVVAVLLIVAGLLALDWKYQWLLTYPVSLSTGRADDITTASWFPWALAAAGVVVGLLALWWLASHARRPHQSATRLGGSSEHGRLEIDLASVASAVAAHFEQMAPTQSVSGRNRTYGRDQVVEITARLDPRADGKSIAAAAGACTQDVQAALPDGEATCRIILDAPSKSRLSARTSNSTARVH